MRRLLFLLCLAACTDPKPSISAAGKWQGGTGSQVLTLTLTQDGSGNVAGTGTLVTTTIVGGQASTDTRALTVDGAVADNTETALSISLTISSGTAQPFNLDGTLSSIAIVGHLNGSGFNNESIRLQHP